MKNYFKFLAIIALAFTAYQGQSQSKINSVNKHTDQMKAKRVLIVVTSTDEVESTGKKTGLWIEEFAAPYYKFTEQGFEVTVASPKGGKAPIDPKSVLPDYSTETVKRFFADGVAQQKLNSTLALDAVKARDYDAIYYAGGTGPVWDLPQNKSSISLIQIFYADGKPTALVCHAPAALKNVKDIHGQFLIKGKEITGYSNSEEATGQSKDMVPFSLEDMVNENGGHYVKGEDWHPFVVSEGNLITGQNPASSGPVADKIIELLKTIK